MKKIPLHWQIIAGIVLGIIVGIILSASPGGTTFSTNWIKPFGTIFINGMKLIAIPLIVTSLVTGIANLRGMTQFSSMGKKTLLIYLSTTVLALSVGLIIVNIVSPGGFVSTETRTELINSFGGDAGDAVVNADELRDRGPLQFLVDMVPENILGAAMSNSNMLQVILFTVLFGFGLMSVTADRSKRLMAIFEAANLMVLKVVDLLMKVAPFGVFALMTAMVTESPSADIFVALAAYGGAVILGLVVLMYGCYSIYLRVLGKMSPRSFFTKMIPAQLLAFSTSSSAATLPATMACVNDRIGVDKKVSSFVLPIGATINMDGTCLYQAVAAVFIAQVMGDDLTLSQQLVVVLTAALASIGSAPVPGAGILMLVIVLESVGVNPAGLALILAVDRPLDMCRTVVNVTGDAMICVVVNRMTGKTLSPGGTDS